MKKQTSNKTGILSAFASLWNEETIEYVSLSDINDIDEKTKKALIEADNNTDKKGIEAAKYIVTGEKIKKEMSNIKHVINAKTEEAMRKMLDNQVKDKNDSNEEKEISD